MGKQIFTNCNENEKSKIIHNQRFLDQIDMLISMRSDEIALNYLNNKIGNYKLAHWDSEFSIWKLHYDRLINYMAILHEFTINIDNTISNIGNYSIFKTIRTFEKCDTAFFETLRSIILGYSLNNKQYKNIRDKCIAHRDSIENQFAAISDMKGSGQIFLDINFTQRILLLIASKVEPIVDEQYIIDRIVKYDKIYSSYLQTT